MTAPPRTPGSARAMSAEPPDGREDAPPLDFGHRSGVIRSRSLGLSLRIDLRSVVVCIALAGASVAITMGALVSGDFPVAVGEAVRALMGDATDQVRLIVLEWRLPRAVTACLLGAALGRSGAIFQSITRNPLGSPDIIGFNTGAYTGALLVIVAFGGSYFSVTGGALLGGIGTGALVYLLAFKRGIRGFRLIITGIAVSAMLASVNTYFIINANLDVAMAAAVWGAGSLNGTGWSQAIPAGIITIGLVIVTMTMAPSLRALELGDDMARAVGVRVETSRVILLFLGLALTAVATATAGPIAFVSLAAPQIARLLTRTASVTLLPATAMGAVMLTGADWLAQHAIPDTHLPVGVVTVSIGGVYFVWLLIRQARKR